MLKPGFQTRQNKRSLRGMLTMSLCYSLLLGAAGLCIIWLPMAKPEQANSSQQLPMLMQLEPVNTATLAEPLDLLMPDVQLHQHVTGDTDFIPALDHATPVTSQSIPTETQSLTMTYNGRPLRAVKTIMMTVTAYSPDEQSCGKWADGITASGYSVWTNAGKLVAADTRLLPFGSILTVPGYNGSRPVPVLDIGGKIKGKRLDVLYPTHAIATRWGVKQLPVTVWEYAY
jgi:3D (Asp-Asp-Asp) domain-containing protein